VKVARGLTPAGETVWARVTETDRGPEYHRLEGQPSLGKSPVVLEKIELTQLLAPVEPRMLICIGLNYFEHAASLGLERPKHPVIVPKGLNAVRAPFAPIEIPRFLRSEKVDYEGELAVVIGRNAKNVPHEEALDYVLGYTCANDVSARDWQFEFGGGQWSRGKNFDTFAPLGPWLVTADSLPDPTNLRISTWVNDQLRQQSTTARMIFPVAELIAFLSGSSTLPAGTVILTGTPAGVGMKQTPPTWLKNGDIVRIEIESIGTLINPVVEEMLAAG
jgi:2-keto-4-pentenoate hydratase/2-oxohepta-3-ene-1,7-dioic acid hydratase in catechol pathway